MKIIAISGGAARSIAEGVLLAQEMVQVASKLEAVPCGLEDLVLGLKCGSSDTTSGLAPNPALGIASDLIIEGGGTSILGEVTEFIGAEHLLAQHARDKLRDHMDIDVSSVMEGTETLPEAGKRIVAEIMEVASGKLTKAEISGYTKAMDIYMVGPVI